MKVLLMHRDQDFDLQAQLPTGEADLCQDLELDTLFEAMSRGDRFIAGVAKAALLRSLTDPADIRFRQQVVADTLSQPAILRQLYGLGIEAIQGERRFWRPWTQSPQSILSCSLQVLEFFVTKLRELRLLADEHKAEFASDGFRRFFEMSQAELDDAYFERVEEHLERLRLKQGTLMSARLGRGNKGIDYVLRLPRERGWFERLTSWDRSRYSFQIPERDQAGARAYSELEDRAINDVANALAQSADHIKGFFTQLVTELAFYVGCLNLHEQLDEKGEPTCTPDPAAPGTMRLSARDLYDVSLALKLESRVVVNDLNADGKSLVMITGANQGGKSTFLRSVGQAQLMTQSGMFVPASAFVADLRDCVLTHHKREEDPSMESGKLDDELVRMSAIADALTPGGLLLFNESFASTNEREGSEIALQVIRALDETGVKTVYVTHLYELAHRLHASERDEFLFLRAQRREDGERTYKLFEGAPLPTSYGKDTYRRAFGTAADRGRNEIVESRV